jgi:solute:Na+ symporter, SSS family
VLEAFYRKVRPGGPGWKRQRAATGLGPCRALGIEVLPMFAAVVFFGLMSGVGGLLLLCPGVGLANLVAAAVAWGAGE